MPPRLVWYRGKWYAAEQNGGRIVRRALRTADRAVAERRLADLTRRPAGDTVAAIMQAYLADKAGRASAPAMGYAWAALTETFAALRPDQITRERCRQYAQKRTRQGAGPGTVIKELGVLRAALKHAGKAGLAVFEMPSTPPPKDRWLTRDEFARLLEATDHAHLRLFMLLAITTGARSAAILDLTWDRVDMARRLVALGSPETRGKARATVPMNETAFAALEQAHSVRASDYVIEYGGHRVARVLKGFREAVRRAGLEGVTPHTLRHTAATWMAIDGVPIEKIARYLGHSDSRVTERVYAKHSPDYLKSAAAAVEIQGVFLRAIERGPVNGGGTQRPKKAKAATPKQGKSKR